MSKQPTGFDGPAQIRTNGDPVFPWILVAALGYWIRSAQLAAQLHIFAKAYKDLIKYFGYSPLHGKETVHADFPTDFASIPRIVWMIIAPHEIRRPAIFHDAHYRDLKWLKAGGWVSRKDVRRYRKLFDDLFLEAMDYLEPQIPKWKRKAAYHAVRWFAKV